MPRIRTVKPQFWLDEKLGAIQRDARLLYIGLWNLSDDQGVFEWRPARIKVQLFPYDNDVTNETIEQWLLLLVGSGDVIQFSCNGFSFGFIPTFLKHQDIKKPSQWKFATIPKELVTNHPSVSEELDTDGERVGEESPTNHQSVLLGNRESSIGNRLKGIGNRESVIIKAFDKVKNNIKPDFLDIENFDEEVKKCIYWWSESRKELKKPKLALRNWMNNARQYKKEHDNGRTRTNQSSIKHQADVKVLR